MIGKTLAHYEITGLLGKGGMGEVYRAHDSKLERDVAIKVLPEVLAGDKDRLARFGREAKLLAAFNHPSIAGIHELGHEGGTHFLVMELVEGRDLDKFLATGAAELDDILSLFGQLAEALESAHERGIVHRDLKPANIKVTDDGKAKILDFGLGKAFETTPVSAISRDSTVALGSESASLQTGEGRILGTPAYMSPEQARGLTVDKRADIWAFGCCLYEALAGKRPFQGTTVTDVIAEIVKSDPDWDALPRETPARVRVLIWRCLQKDPRRRLRDIGEARLELSGEVTDPSGALPSLGSTAAPAGVSRKAVVIAASIALVVGGAVAGVITWSTLHGRTRSTAPAVKRFEIDIGQAAPLEMLGVSAELAASPDGKRIAYTANVDGTKRLYLRELDKMESLALPRTENAWRPFFSPDGRWIAFFVPGDPSSRDGRLVKISVEGGTLITLCRAFPPAGGTWLEDGSIVFTNQDEELDLTLDPFLSHLFRVSENGGTPERLTKADARGRGELTHVLPTAAHGQDFFLFSIVDTLGRFSTALLDIKTGQHQVLLQNTLGAQYVDSGHIVFVRGKALWATTFDIASRTVGEPVLVQADVQMNPYASAAPFAVSTDGSLVYPPTAPVVERQRTLVWVDHDGREETIAVPPGRYWWPRVSPDGSRVAMSIQVPPNGNEDIWIHRFERAQSLTRFTFAEGPDTTPLWSPDGRYLYFSSHREGESGLFRRRADGTGAVEKLRSSPETKYPAEITPDGAALLFGLRAADGGSFDIMELRLGDYGDGASIDQRVRPLLETAFGEGGTKLSPDGKWLAYNTDETVPTQVFVRPYPNLDDGRWQVSTDGGVNPTWSADGKEIYYRSGRNMMAVSVDTEPTFRAGRPRELFEADYFYAPDLSVQYDLEYPGRKRFLMIKALADTRTTKLIYVENWTEELKALTTMASADGK